MHNFLETKKPQVFILLGFFSAYLLVFFVTRVVASVKVFEFAFLSIAFGFAPAYYFRNVFSFENLIGWVLHSGILGIILIPFLFLFLGWLKINFIFEYSVVFLYSCSLIGLLSLFFLDGEQIRPYLTFAGIRNVDVFIVIVFLVFSVILTLRNFSQIDIHWDSFTFWGLDARYIFEQDQLRDAKFNANLMIHDYTSFLPLYYAIIYDLYGAIVEQFAAWINIYINLLAMLSVYWFVRHKSNAHKFIVAATTLIVSYSAISIIYIFSMYADLLCAFLLLVYFLILIDDSEKDMDTYWLRVALLLLIAIAFYFIKSPFISFTFILIGIFALYDWKFIYGNFQSLIKKRNLWIAIASISILCILRFIYFANIDSGNHEMAASGAVFDLPSISITPSLEYLVGLLQYLIRETPYFLGLWWLTLSSIFFVKEKNKQYFFIFSSCLLIFLIPVISYFMTQRSLDSDSLLRYSAIVMYLFPLAISFVHISNDQWKAAASILILSVIAFYVFLNILWPLPLTEKFSLVDGTYQSGLAKYSKFAEKVTDITGPDAKILIADDLPGETTTNMLTPAIYIRYFMMDNNVGSQYQTQTIELYDYAVDHHADFILLLSYANFFANCEPWFTTDHDYLIYISRGNINLEPEDCVFSPFEIIDLGSAVK
jgi:hypothetical protein